MLEHAFLTVGVLVGQAGFAGQKELYELLYNLVYNEAAPDGADTDEVEDELLDELVA